MQRLISMLGLILVFGCASAPLERLSPVAALTPASSWAEIRSAPSVIARAPLVFFGTTGVSVLDLCRRGDRVERGDSLTMGADIPASAVRRAYAIPVVYILNAGAEHPHDVYLFTKHYAIPACGGPSEAGAAAPASR
ncbi:MAG TPA: hypothetical protein VMG58_18185 [Candidatus Sulfotelmatobacter sp.]|nr:hypothetical protein [Candidatus Sulfotelmatobacter sp.]